MQNLSSKQNRSTTRHERSLPKTVQIAFTRADGTPVALCIIKANNKDRKPITSEELLGMASASWNVDGLAYLLIGGDTAPMTQTEATAFKTWATTASDI